MHRLHDYIAKQLAERLKARHILVWYDARREFTPFVAELRGAPSAGGGTARITMRGIEARLAEYRGSYFEIRAVVEPLMSADVPEPVIIYLPGCERDRHGSVLMELEKAGDCYEPQLKGSHATSCGSDIPTASSTRCSLRSVSPTKTWRAPHPIQVKQSHRLSSKPSSMTSLVTTASSPRG